MTIGKKLLDIVGWKPGERVMWTARTDGGAQLERVSIVAETAGSLARFIPKDKRGKPFAEVREATQRMVAEELAKEGVSG